MIKKRSIVSCIILSIVTCGIYSLFWIYSICGDIAEIKHDNVNDGVKVILLSLITCGLYLFYWVYKTSTDIYFAQEDLGLRASNNAVINLILSIFGLNIIAMCIMQSDINNISDELYRNV